MVSGIVGLIAMFSVHNVAAFFWTLLTAALSLVVGVLLLWRPVEGDVAVRDGKLRMSPSYYNDRQDVDQLMDALPRCRR